MKLPLRRSAPPVLDLPRSLRPVTDEEALTGARADDTYNERGGAAYDCISVLPDFRAGRGCPCGDIRIDELSTLLQARKAALIEGVDATEAWRRIFTIDLRDHHGWHKPELCSIGHPHHAEETI